MRKVTAACVGILLFAFVALIVFRGAVARTLGHACLRRLTGVDAEVRSVNLGWSRAQFEVRNFNCTNLHVAGDIIAADVPRLTIAYEPWSLLGNTLHIYELTCEIRRLEFTRLDAKPHKSGTAAGSRSAQRDVRVDLLQVRLDGTLVYRSPAGTQEISSHSEATIRNVRDLETLRRAFLPDKRN